MLMSNQVKQDSSKDNTAPYLDLIKPNRENTIIFDFYVLKDHTFLCFFRDKIRSTVHDKSF